MPTNYDEIFNSFGQNWQKTGYIPPATAFNWQQQMPMSDKDKKTFGDTPAGLPEDWDYKTSELGPDGQAKWDGQIGWTPQGDRFYGGTSEIENWYNGLQSRLDAPKKVDGREVEFEQLGFFDKLITSATRFGGETANLVISAIQVPAQVLKQTRGAVRGAAGEGFTDDPITSGMHEADFGVFNFVRDIVQAVNPLGIANELLQATRGLLSDPAKAAEGFSTGWESGRILYTTLNEPLRQAEYVRRMASGENAWLLAQELQNPIREMWGEIVFDPLNAIGLLIKPLQAAGFIGDAKKAVSVPIKGLEAVMDGTRAVSTAEAVAKSQNLAETIIKTSQSMVGDLSKVRAGLFDFTPESIKGQMAQKFGLIIGNVIAGTADDVSKIDKTWEIFRALAAQHSGDIAQVTDGLSALRRAKLPLNVMFSEAGMHTGYILNKILGNNPDELMDLVKAAKTPGDILASLGPRLDTAIDDIVPQIKTAKNLGVGGKIVKGAGDLTGSALYTKAHGFFGSVYMGYNPGFGVRAFGTDIFHAFVDTGLGGAADAAKVLPDYVARSASFGVVNKGKLFSPTKAEGWVSKVFGRIPEAAAEGLTAAGRKLKGPITELAGAGQARVSMVSFKHFAEKALKSQYDVIARTTFGSLKTAGMTDEQLTLMRRLFDEHHDAQKVVDAMKASTKAGYVQADALLWLDDVRYDMLKKFGKLDEYKDAMRALKQTGATAEEAIAKHNEIFKTLEDYAQEAGKIPVGLHPAEDAADIIKAAEKGGKYIAPNVNELAKIQTNANKAVESKISELFTQARKAGSNMGVNIDEVLPAKLLPYTDGSFVMNAENYWKTKKSAPMFAIYDELKAIPETADASKYWKLFGLTGAQPVNLTKSMMIRQFWDSVYFPQARNFFRGVREELVKKSDEALKLLSKDERLVNKSYAKQLEGLLEDARAWDTGAVTRAGRMVTNSNIDDVRALANMNGVASATKTGGYSTQLLRTINKYLPSPKSIELDDVAKYFKTTTEELLSSAKSGKLAPFGKDSITELNAVGSGKKRVALFGGGIGGEIPEISDKFITRQLDSGAIVVMRDSTDIDDLEFIAGRVNELLEGNLSEVDRGVQLGRILGYSEADVRKWAVNLVEVNAKPLKYTDEALIPYDVAEQALKARAIEKGTDFIPLANRIGATEAPAIGNLIPPRSMLDDSTVTPARNIAEQMGGIRKLQADMEQLLKTNWDLPVASTGNKQISDALDLWAGDSAGKFLEAKVIAERVGTAGRDFTVLPYLTGKTNLDTLLSVIYPYSFWHTRTYTNWMRRIVTNPEVIAAYAKYKSAMGEIHAGAPDWWKYNIRSDELLGIEQDNPLFFNLESSLNPLNGLIGIDFTDSDKRVNWWTKTLDDIGKWGPAPWTFFNFAIAMALHAQGEKEAAGLWAGRLIPQTKTAQALLSVLGFDPYDLDPAVSLFSGGIDPYLRKSGIPRALAAMIFDGTVTEEQAIDASNTQSGEVWDMAYKRAVNERAPGQLSSFVLGQGFKARSLGDLEADKFYDDLYRLYAVKDEISPTAYRQSFDDLRDAYPFMDALLISKKAGDDKDTALAYNVLSRLPPGSSSLAQTVGIDERLISKFYDGKGAFEEWTDTEQERFMAGINDLSAILATPQDATRQEWSQVRALYGQMQETTKQMFGEDILDQIDAYFAEKEITDTITAPDVVNQALMFQAQAKATNPLLATYYGGVDVIAKYYESLMYAEVREELGADIWGKFATETITDAEKKQYYAITDGWEARIDAAILRVGGYLPEAKPAMIREDAPDPLNSFQQDFADELQPPQVDLQAVLSQLGQEASNLVMDFALYGQAIPYTVRNKLERIAEEMGVSYYELLQLIQQGAQGQ